MRPTPPLSLGPASRLLGVDPDTLRRWADEGRIDSFTTAGGHRRFHRATLERILQARRHDATLRLATLGATTDRLSRAYRRGYADEAGAGRESVPPIPTADREAFRDGGRAPRRRARSLTSTRLEDEDRDEPKRGGRRRPMSSRPARGAPASALAEAGQPVCRRPPAVPRPSSARSPAAAPSIPIASARSTTARRRCSTGCLSVSSPRHEAGHEASTCRAGSIPGAAPSLLGASCWRRRALLDQWRERRQTFQLVWAAGHALLRDRLGVRGDRGGERLERAALPHLVPHGRDLDGRLARPRDRVPPGAYAVRLHVRALPRCWRACSPCSPSGSSTTRAPGRAPILYLIGAVDPRAAPSRSRRTSRTIAGRRSRRAAVIGTTILSLVLMADGDAGGARLRPRSRDRRADGRALPGHDPAPDSVPEHHGRLRADARRAVLGLRVHAQEAGARLLPRPDRSRATSSSSTS